MVNDFETIILSEALFWEPHSFIADLQMLLELSKIVRTEIES